MSSHTSDGAEKYFESHVEEIKAACNVCPVEAIKLEIEEEREFE